MTPRKVIELFGGLTPMARALGHKHVSTIQGWDARGSIPHWRHSEILAAAKRENIKLTTEDLSSEQPGGEAA